MVHSRSCIVTTPLPIALSESKDDSELGLAVVMALILFMNFIYNGECSQVGVILVRMVISSALTILNTQTVYLGGCPDPGEVSCWLQSHLGVHRRDIEGDAAGERWTQPHTCLLFPCPDILSCSIMHAAQKICGGSSLSAEPLIGVPRPSEHCSHQGTKLYH